MVSLLQHVEKVIDLRRQQRNEKAQRQPEESKPEEPKPLESAKEVTEEIRARLAKLLFGSDGEANATASMKRLLDSWVVMGYPEEGKQLGTVVVILVDITLPLNGQCWTGRTQRLGVGP